VKNHWLIALNMIAFVAFAAIACAFQTSLWMQVLGGFPPPLFWIVLMTYIILHRRMWEGVLLTYVLTFVLSAYTAEPFEHFLLNNMICMVFILIVKNRIYWSSPNYFMLMSAATTALHFLLVLILSQFLDKNPLRSPEVFHWMLSFLITMLLSLPLYHFLKWFDDLTKRDETAESTSGLA
jgi:hypothetical protein